MDVPHPQVMITKEVAEAAGMTLSKLSATGTSVLVEGVLVATPEGTKQVGPPAAPCDPMWAHALTAAALPMHTLPSGSGAEGHLACARGRQRRRDVLHRQEEDLV